MRAVIEELWPELTHKLPPKERHRGDAKSRFLCFPSADRLTRAFAPIFRLLYVWDQSRSRHVGKTRTLP